uniref:Uncharacterized protein n=1 Tax=Micrurus paraensis TaxID=1970185 RepID=A0A2D4KKX3_9SAUR
MFPERIQQACIAFQQHVLFFLLVFMEPVRDDVIEAPPLDVEGVCVKRARCGSAHLGERGYVIGEESLEKRECLGALQAEERAMAQREANGGRSYIAAAEV